MKLWIALVVMAAVGGGYALSRAQDAMQDVDPNLRQAYGLAQFEVKMNGLNPKDGKYENGTYKLARVYDAAAASKVFARYVLSDKMKTYYQGQENAQSAPQASQAADMATAELAMLQTAQNQRLIEQNDKIIALLEKLAAKK